MSNFTINFSVSPWLLLLLIPITALTLIPYFKMNKRYRRNRNKIISMILHLIVAVLAVSVLAGVSFAFDNQNKENEIMLLVDCSDSLSVTQEKVDEQIQSILYTGGDRFKMGIVTFGKDQYYAAELSNKPDEVYEHYLTAIAEHPVDKRASDVAAALEFAKDKFKKPETAKIVVISDGFETDGNALSTVKSFAKEGITVDSLKITRESQNEVGILSVSVPEKNYKITDKIDIQFSIQTSVDFPSLRMEIYENNTKRGFRDENDVLQEYFEIPVEGVRKGGILNYTYAGYGFIQDETDDGDDEIKELHFVLLCGDERADTFEDNNSYYTYVHLQNFNKVLILEGVPGDGDKLENVLVDNDDPFVVTSFCLQDIVPPYESFPDSLEDLSEYDQIILANVSNEDLLNSNLPSDYDVLLNRYVKELGGSVFVVGGNELGTSGTAESKAHAFNREDFANAKQSGHTAYADMLPVEVTNYRPPLGVMLVIDCSGSMGQNDKMGQKIYYAKEAAKVCISNLDDHDYVGIIAFGTSAYDALPIQQVVSVREDANRIIDERVKVGIDGDSSSTMFDEPLTNAGQDLAAIEYVDMKHIIVITDGEPAEPLWGSSGGMSPYGPIIENNYIESGITTSIIHIGDSGSESMKTAATEYGKGRYIPIKSNEVESIVQSVREELAEKIIDEATYTAEKYDPIVSKETEIFTGINKVDGKYNLPKLGGYFGTKLKQNTTVPLRAQYSAPLYAEWQYGKGRVGAFMCSLNGDAWSDVFLDPPQNSTSPADATAYLEGRKLINNIVKYLMPTTDITMTNVQVEIVEDNFSTQVSIYTEIQEGERVSINVYKINDEIRDPVYQEMIEQGRSRTSFAIEEPGTYQVEVQKFASDGLPYDGSLVKKFRVFSYSEEYYYFTDDDLAASFMNDLAVSGNGTLLEEGVNVFDKYDTAIHRVIDPTLAFIITAIVLFLLDVAVRKFKFKWPHEIIRDRRERQRLNGEKR